MKLSEWLRIARHEQLSSTNEEGSHLFANYRYGRRSDLVDRNAARRFQINLAPVVLSPPPEDYAGTLVFWAVSEQFAAPGFVPADDFRFMGPKLPASCEEIFANISQTTVGNANTTSEGAGLLDGRPVEVRAPNADSLFNPQRTVRDRVLWLTRADDVLAMIGQLRPRTQDQLFAALVDRLGLKPAGGTWRQARSAPWRLTASLRLFQLSEANHLNRPHALSGGFSDRFLGATSTANAPYGSTAQCSTGNPCFAEAIARAGAVREILPGDPKYEDFCAKIAAIDAALVRKRVPRNPLTGRLMSNAFEPKDRYLQLQARILALL